MGIGEPVAMEDYHHRDHLDQGPHHGERFHSEFHYGFLTKFILVIAGVFVLLTFLLFFPIVVLSFIANPLAGLFSLILPIFVSSPIILGSLIGFLITMMRFREVEKSNYAELSRRDLFILYKPSSRLQTNSVIVPYNMIEEICIDPDIVDREARSRALDSPLKYLWSIPIPPLGGFYNGMASKDDLVMLKLKGRIEIQKVTPGFKWVVKPETHWVDILFFNVKADKKPDFKTKLEQRVGAWANG